MVHSAAELIVLLVLLLLCGVAFLWVIRSLIGR